MVVLVVSSMVVNEPEESVLVTGTTIAAVVELCTAAFDTLEASVAAVDWLDVDAVGMPPKEELDADVMPMGAEKELVVEETAVPVPARGRDAVVEVMAPAVDVDELLV